MRHAWHAAILPAAALVLAIAPLPPALVERAFSNGAYALVQPSMTALSNRVPFAWLDALIVVGAILTVWRVVTTWRRRTNLAGWAGRLAWNGVCAGAAVYLAFLAAWGFNYRRVPASERLAVDARRVNEARLRAFATRAVHEANRLWPARRDETRLAGELLVGDLAPAFAAATHMTGTPWHVEPGRPKAS